MTSPRDWHESDRTGVTRAARLFSNIVSPPVIFAVMGLTLSLYSLPLAQALAWAAIYGLFVSLLPILFVLYLLEHRSRGRTAHERYRGTPSALYCGGRLRASSFWLLSSWPTDQSCYGVWAFLMS